VKPIFSTLAKSVFSPVDYFFKGIMAIRDAVTTQTNDGQRRLKVGAALAVAATSFAYVGVAVAIAVHALAGLAITAGTIIAAPIILPVLLVTIAGIGAFREHNVLKVMRANIQRDKAMLTKLQDQFSTLKENDSLSLAKKNILAIQIERIDRRIKKDTVAVNYQARRRNTAIMMTLGYATAAFGLLFPPLLIAGAALVVAAVTIDVVDKHIQRKNIAKAKKTAKQQSALSQRNESDSTEKDKDKNKDKDKDKDKDKSRLEHGEGELEIVGLLTKNNKDKEKKVLSKLTEDKQYQEPDKPVTTVEIDSHPQLAESKKTLDQTLSSNPDNPDTFHPK
jgi:hypothetical protein